MAAEGYLRAKLYFRKVFLQDIPFIEKSCPTHPVFRSRFCMVHKTEWGRWKNMVLEFHDRMDEIEADFIAPPLPLVGPVVGMQMATVDKWLQELTKQTLAAHGLQDSPQQVIIPFDNFHIQMLFVSHKLPSHSMFFELICFLQICFICTLLTLHF